MMFVYESRYSLEFIDTATVPVIKLKVDLEKIAKQIEKHERTEGGFVYSKRIPIE
jgi:hypothetical protein